MRYAELVEKNATEREIQEYLADGEATTITLRIPGNLHESAKETAALRPGRSVRGYLYPLQPSPGGLSEKGVRGAASGRFTRYGLRRGP